MAREAAAAAALLVNCRRVMGGDGTRALLSTGAAHYSDERHAGA